eukprot:TRINITY_DN29003_c0_g1_i2.p1 TRINITY_DN29003_c0_g1~~TRINITY_DN29003_c0_g1_i2.p1  ORF type:complete len:652 (+),score=148.60 TRINITY_DN29003_c0_g1_i2:153-2108(+)
MCIRDRVSTQSTGLSPGPMTAGVLKVANCSGFYGDRLSAAKEMVEGGPIDALTGDYLAELTMAILHRQRSEGRQGAGYVGTFLKQLKDVLKPCVAKGIKVVTNAGGLNPGGMAAEVDKLSRILGIETKVMWIDGDDLAPRITELQAAGEAFSHMDKHVPLSSSGKEVLTANAYLGCWGIKAALDQGAHVVICPRVTDAAVVMGVAAWRFKWDRKEWDKLAGALTAGHIIECGGQACGGNYSFFHQVPSFRNVGFPIAEIQENGDFTITKHPNTGGLVSVGTVTAQLLYETSSPAYLNPDCTAHFDSLQIQQVGPDRVRVTSVKGSPPPPVHKVCINLADGFTNGVDLMLVGLDLEDKANLFLDSLFESLGGKQQYSEVHVELIRNDREHPTTNAEATATLRVVVRSPNPALCGPIFTQKMTELALCSWPGFTWRNSLRSGPVIRYWPAFVNSHHVTEMVHMPDGFPVRVRPTQHLMDLPVIQQEPFGLGEVVAPAQTAGVKKPYVHHPLSVGPVREIPLGRLFAARSGDKGGCANLGVWAETEAACDFLFDFLTVPRLQALLPDTAHYDIARYELRNLKALNFYIRGILGDGVSSNTRLDPQAKSLGEYLRSKVIKVPLSVLEAQGEWPVSDKLRYASKEWRGHLHPISKL